MKKPRGLIFDFDGTLVDSMPLHWRAWDSVCQRHGIEFSEQRHNSLGGMPCDFLNRFENVNTLL